jgi:hypothetical protein
MAKKRDNKNQIYRIDGSKCFVEVLNDSFPIGKVHLGFYTYDMNKAAGSRFTNNVPIYIDIPDFLALCSEVQTGQLALKKENRSNFEFYYKNMGGTSALQLNKRGKARNDGMGISRQLKIIPGERYPFVLIAESGPGQANDKGLIVPKYKDGRPEQRVMVPMDGYTLKKFLLIIQAHIQAYYTAQYVTDPNICDRSHDDNNENGGYNGYSNEPDSDNGYQESGDDYEDSEPFDLTSMVD